MTFIELRRPVVPGLLLASLMLAVAGCQSSDSGALSPTAQDKAPTKIRESDLRAYCPTVSLRDGTTVFATYAKGGEKDPSKVVYQASIGEVTRSCIRADGQLTMNVAVAGRVVPGPNGGPGSVTLPIRIAVMGAGDAVLYSKLHQHQVAVGDTSAATQFVFSDEAVTFPDPGSSAVNVYAGFDEGAPAGAESGKKKRRKAN